MRELSISIDDERPPVTALLERPRGARAVYVLAHGAGAGMRHRFMEAMSAALAREKIATLRFNFPYTEAGRKRPDHKKTLMATIAAVLHSVPRTARGLPVIAGGKSMGGRMSSMLMSEAPVEAVRGLIFLGFPLHAPKKPGSERGEHLTQVKVPMLFLQGTRDPLADLERMRPLCRELGRRATLHVVEGGDHSFDVLKRSGRTPEEVVRELSMAVSDWVARVVG